MAVDTENGFSGPFLPNGATTVFPFTFTAPSAAEVAVFLRAADGTETDAAGFTVTLTPGGGGNVTFAVAPPAGPELYILLAPNFTQDVQFENGSAWLAEPVNEVADRAAARDQAMKREIDRSLRVPLGETPPEGGSFAGNLTGKAIGFVNGKMVPVPNDASSAAQLVADVGVIAAEVDLDQQAVQADKVTVAADKALTVGYRNQAQTYRDSALTFATAAEAYTDGAIFDTTALGVGVGGVADTKPFLVPNGDGNLALWRNVSGVATPIGTPQFISTSGAFLTAAVADVEAAAATVGSDTGNPASLGAIGGVDSVGGVKLLAAAYYSVPQKSFLANNVMTMLRAQMAHTVVYRSHSQAQGSGVFGAGATVNPRSGINGSPPRHHEWLLQQFRPDWRVINNAQSAQDAAEIAARMGAIPINITLGSGTALASSGAVACTCSPGSNGPSAQRGTSVDVYTGYIGTQLCKLTNTGTGPNAATVIYTIEQVGGVGAISVTPGTPFWLAADPLDYAINIIFATENDTETELEQSVHMVSAMVEKLPRDERRFIVVGDWPFVGANPSREINTPWHNNMLAKHKIFRERYGADFFDPYRYFRGEWPYDGSIYPSVWQTTGFDVNQSDNNWPTGGAWQGRGILPYFWMSAFKGGVDTSHWHQDTNYWFVRALNELHFKPKGWLTS